MKRTWKHLWNWLVDSLILRAMRTPYTHLYHADGTTYMERYWLAPPVTNGDSADANAGTGPVKFTARPLTWCMQRLGIACRLHRICTADYDPHLHDHPWDFYSLVLRGGYLESRPADLSPCFEGGNIERTEETVRMPGSFARRRATDRHLISSVLNDTWTLVFVGPKRHWWGFYTPSGKVYWRDYPSCHAAARFEGEAP